MTAETQSARSADFAHRVLRCGVLSGLEAAAFWSSPGKLTVMVRHPYGPWRSANVTNVNGRFAESERGSVVLATDVAVRLRNATRDRPPDRRVSRCKR
jgi:hypothetical protein